MVELTFIGTGEAFDSERTTTSYFVETDKTSFMIDCGHTSPSSLRRILEQRQKSLAEVPGALLITHYHGDHFAGVPALLMPIWEEITGVVGERKDGKQRKIEIASGHNDIEAKVREVMEQYPTFLDRFSQEGPSISYQVLNQERENEFCGFKIRAAPTTHGLPNFSYRFERNGSSFAISGDGAFTEESRSLFRGVSFLAHEGFFVDQASRNHASIKEVVEYAIEQQIPNVAIVHVNRQEREEERKIKSYLEMAKDAGVNVYLPEDHDRISI